MLGPSWQAIAEAQAVVGDGYRARDNLIGEGQQKGCHGAMNSAELKNLTVWKRWNENVAGDAPPAPGIYVFRLADGKTIQRLKGNSDILYIGSSKKLRERFKGHLKVIDVERNIAYRLQRVRQEIGGLQVAWELYDRVDKATVAERLFLTKYEKDHIEFPPLNRSEPGKRSRMIEEWLKLPLGKMPDLLATLEKIRSGALEIHRTG